MGEKAWFSVNIFLLTEINLFITGRSFGRNSFRNFSLRWPNTVFSSRSRSFADAMQRAHKDWKATNMHGADKARLIRFCLFRIWYFTS